MMMMTMMKMVHANVTRHDKQRLDNTKVGAVGIIITTSIAISSSGSSSNSTTI